MRFPNAPEPEEIDRMLVAELGEARDAWRSVEACPDPCASAGYRRELAPVVIHRAVLAAASAGIG
jgi:NTP pyrophosphatase (non-canonical NTP hydrolase)